MVRTAVAGEIIRMTEMTTPWAGDAMDTLKMKIGLITKESKESSAKMEKAEKVGEEICQLSIQGLAMSQATKTDCFHFPELITSIVNSI